MRRLLNCAIVAPKIFRTTPPTASSPKLKSHGITLCTSSFQGDVSNDTERKKALLSDRKLFESKFDELVAEVTTQDLHDPALTDARDRLKQVCACVRLFLVGFRGQRR